jgi:hypothetical protein
MDEEKGLLKSIASDVEREIKISSSTSVETTENEGWKSDPKGILDVLLGKISSRKFAVWLTGTVALFMGSVDADAWVAISLAYIGSAALVDIAAVWKHGSSRG